MWFWSANEIIELVPGIPVPQFRDESSWIRGSELVRSSSVSVGCFLIHPKTSSHTLIEGHWCRIQSSGCSLVQVLRRFGETYGLRFQSKAKPSKKPAINILLLCVLVQSVVPKSKKLHISKTSVHFYRTIRLQTPGFIRFGKWRLFPHGFLINAKLKS